MYDYKEVGIYFDLNLTLIGVPCGKSPKYGIASLDIFIVLESEYGDDKLEEFLEKLFDLCFTKKSVEGQIDPLIKYTNAKSYAAAVKNFKLVEAQWLKNEGFSFTPTQKSKKHRGAFEPLEQEKITVPTLYEKGSLAKAFRQALSIANQQA